MVVSSLVANEQASHNSYITGHQLTSVADAGMYSRLLLCGCRSLEVDIGDGMDGPVVTHHYTLVTTVPLQKVRRKAAEAVVFTVSARCEPVPLKKVLQMTLALGNYLNGGTNKGAAWGFTLDTLSKLSGTKTI